MKVAKKNNKYATFILLSVIILQIFSGFLTTSVNLGNLPLNNQEDNETDLSLNSDFLPLDLVTPQNKTYLEPDEGYFPATFGFDYQQFSVKGTDIDFIDWVVNPYTNVEIERTTEGHNRYISVNQPYGWGAIYNNFTDQMAGTIELWIRVDEPSDHIAITLKDDELSVIAIKLDSWQFSWKDQNNVWQNVKYFDDTKWHHLRVDFYSDNTFDWYIDGEKFVYRENFLNNLIDGIDQLYFKEYGIGILNLDAIGYSWDPYYNVGDNLAQGLLISFTYNQDLNWTVFSLDNQKKRTIKGNTVLVLPDEGSHHIQLFGKDIYGNDYQSEKVYFEVYLPIEIKTPESKDYPYMAGYYAASYGFEDDKIGSAPFNWTDSSAGGCTSTIVKSYNTHKNVLKLSDVDGNNARVEKNFTSQSSGTIEFWLLAENINLRTYMVLRNSAGQIAYYLAVHNSYLRILYNNPLTSINIPIIADQWYHIKTTFDCVEQVASVWIDGNLKSETVYFNADISSIEKFQLYTNNDETNYVSYFDAIGFSWDSKYKIGDNAYEGLFVSYVNRTNFKWVGYSFDGHEVIKDTLNKTFSMPSIGQHSIQLFGKDYTNHIYQSHLIQFNVEPIDILTPENDTYVDPFNGYYPATFGFENTESRSTPILWREASDANCYTEVVDEFSGHKKVLKFSDNNNNGFAAVGQNVGSQVSETIEFLVNPNYVGTDGQFLIYLFSSGQIFLQLSLYDNKISYATREPLIIPPFEILMPVIKNYDLNAPIKSWHHIRIDFNTNLLHDTYTLSVDGVELDTCYSWLDTGPITDIVFNTGVEVGEAPFTVFVDAIGYSWDPNYNVGDNKKEGMIISFKHHPSLETFSYSLNNQSEKPIYAKLIIPMPQYGEHQVQMYGTDSKGIKYESKVRHFRYSPIEIISPENITYIDPSTGHYFSTFGFEDTKHGETPNGWHDYSTGNCVPMVVDEFSGHKKVLNMIDNDNNGAASVRKSVPRMATGRIEFWMFPNYDNGFIHFTVYSEGTIFFQLYIDQNRKLFSLTRFLGIGIPIQLTMPGQFKDWHHFQLTFNTDTDRYSLSVDGVQLVSDAEAWLQTGPIDSFGFATHTSFGVEPFSTYIDAVGITGLEDGYEVGDNLDEGMLVDYDLKMGLDWIGYSLDGQPITYLGGQTTVNLPFVGAHTIQLIGGKSSDTYKSKLISFAIREVPDINQYSVSNSTLDYSLLEDKPYWNVTWGGASVEMCQGLATDSSGNIYVGGHTDTAGSGKMDMILRKYDPSGNLIWGRQFGGSEDDHCYAVAVDSVGNVYIAGDTKSYPGEYEYNGYDLIILKYDQDGNFQWYRTWEGGPSTDTCRSLAVDSMDNIYCGAETYTTSSTKTDAGLVKYDSSGNLLWARTWGGDHIQTFWAIAIDSEDNIYCGGEVYYIESYDMLLLKYNSSGDLQWDLNWGDPNEMEGCYGVAIDSNDNIYIQGIRWLSEMTEITPNHYRNIFYSNILLVKFNKSGDYQWDTLWDGGLDERCFSMTIDSTDNILMGAYTNSYGEGNYDMVLLKYNSLGNLIINTTWGGAKDDICYAVAKDRFNNVYLGGYTQNFGVERKDVCLVKFSQGFKTDITFSVKDQHFLLDESKIQFKFSDFTNFESGNVLYFKTHLQDTYYFINLPISLTPIDLEVDVPIDLSKFQSETYTDGVQYNLTFEIYPHFDCYLKLNSANLYLEDIFSHKGLILFDNDYGYIDFGLDVGSIKGTNWTCKKVEIVMPTHNILKEYYLRDVYYDQFWSFERTEFSYGPGSFDLDLEYNLDPVNHILEISDSDFSDNDDLTKSLNPFTYRLYCNKKKLNLDLYVQNPSLALGREIFQLTQDDYSDYSLFCKIYDPDPLFGETSIPYFMGATHFEPFIEYTIGEYTHRDSMSAEGISVDQFIWNLDAGQYIYNAELMNIVETVYQTSIINTTLLDYYEQLSLEITYNTNVTYAKGSLDFSVNLKNPDDDSIVENVNIYAEKGSWDNHDNVSLSLDTFSTYSGTIYHFETGVPSSSPYLNNGDPAISLLNELSYPYDSLIITPEILEFDPITKHSRQLIEVHLVVDLTDIFEFYNFDSNDLSVLNATIFGSSFIDSFQKLEDIDSYYGKVDIYNSAFDEFQPIFEENIFLETLKYGSLNNPLSLDDLEDYKLSLLYNDNLSQYIDVQNRITIRLMSYFEGNITNPDTYISSFSEPNSVLGALIDFIKFDLVWWKETPNFSVNTIVYPLITPDLYNFYGIPGIYNLQFEFDNPMTHYLTVSQSIGVEVLRRPVNISLTAPTEAYSTDIIEIQAEVSDQLNNNIPAIDALVRFHSIQQNTDMILGEALTDINGKAKLIINNLPLGDNLIWAETIPNQGKYLRPYILKDFEHDYWALNSSSMYPLNIKLSQSKLELKSLAPGGYNATVGEDFYLYIKLIDLHTQNDVYNEPIEIYINSILYGNFISFTPILIEFTEPGYHIVEAIFKGTSYLNKSSTSAAFSATRLSLSVIDIFPEKDLYVVDDSINITVSAYDLTSQSPVENLEISLYLNRSKLLATSLTDHDGTNVFTITILEQWVGKKITFYASNTPKIGMFLQHYTPNFSIEVRRFNCSIIPSINESNLYINEDYEFNFRLWNLDKKVYIDNQLINVTLFKGFDIIDNFETGSSPNNYEILTFASDGVYELSSIHYESELYMLCHNSFTFEVQKRPTYISVNLTEKQLVPGNEFSFTIDLFDALNNLSISNEIISVYEYIYENATLVLSKEPFFINTLNSNTFRWTPLRPAQFEFQFVYDDLLNQNPIYQSSNITILLEVFKRQVRIDTITNGTEFKIEDFVQITSTFLDLNSTFVDPIADLTVRYLIYEGDNLLYDLNHTTNKYGLISFNWQIPTDMANKTLTILVISAKTNFYEWNYFQFDIYTTPLKTSFDIKINPNPHSYINENIVFDLQLLDNRGRNVLEVINFEIICLENNYYESGSIDLSISSILTKSFSEPGLYVFKFSYEGSEIYNPIELEVNYFIDLYPSLLELIEFPKFIYSTQQQLNLTYRLSDSITKDPIQNCLIKLYYVDFDHAELISLNLKGTTDINGEINFTVILPNNYHYESVVILAESEQTTLQESTSNIVEITLTNTPTFINLNTPTDLFVHYIDSELEVTIELFDYYETLLVLELLYVDIVTPDSTKSFSLYYGESFTLDFTQLGIYEITVEYRGSNQYLPSSIEVSYSVSPIPTDLEFIQEVPSVLYTDQALSLETKLKNNLTDNPITGKRIKFYITSDTSTFLIYEGITDSNGIVEYDWVIEESLINKQITVFAEYEYEYYYENSSTLEFLVLISKYEIFVSPIEIPDNLTPNLEENLLFEAFRNTGEIASNCHLQLYILYPNGPQILISEGLTDTNGLYSLNWMPNRQVFDFDMIELQIYVVEDLYYYEGLKFTEEIPVDKISTQLFIELDNIFVLPGETITLEFSLINAFDEELLGEFLYVEIDNILYKSVFFIEIGVNDSYQLSVPNYGLFEVKAYYYGNKRHHPCDNSTVFYSEKLKLNIDLQALEELDNIKDYNYTLLANLSTKDSRISLEGVEIYFFFVKDHQEPIFLGTNFTNELGIALLYWDTSNHPSNASSGALFAEVYESNYYLSAKSNPLYIDVQNVHTFIELDAFSSSFRINVQYRINLTLYDVYLFELYGQNITVNVFSPQENKLVNSYNLVTNESTHFYFTPTELGNYKFEVSFEGIDLYNDCSLVEHFKSIEKEPTSIQIFIPDKIFPGQPYTVVINLYNSTGGLIYGEIIEVKIVCDDIDYDTREIITGVNSSFELIFPIADEYTIKATYDGSANYEASKAIEHAQATLPIELDFWGTFFFALVPAIMITPSFNMKKGEKWKKRKKIFTVICFSVIILFSSYAGIAIVCSEIETTGLIKDVNVESSYNPLSTLYTNQKTMNEIFDYGLSNFGNINPQIIPNQENDSIPYDIINQNASVVSPEADNRPPYIQISNIGDDNILSGVATIEVKAFDMETNVKKVSFKLLEEGFYIISEGFFTYNQTLDLYNYSLDTTQFDDGNYDIVAIAYDENENNNTYVVSVNFLNYPEVGLGTPEETTIVVELTDFLNVSFMSLADGIYNIRIKDSNYKTVYSTTGKISSEEIKLVEIPIDPLYFNPKDYLILISISAYNVLGFLKTETQEFYVKVVKESVLLELEVLENENIYTNEFITLRARLVECDLEVSQTGEYIDNGIRTPISGQKLTFVMADSDNHQVLGSRVSDHSGYTTITYNCSLLKGFHSFNVSYKGSNIYKPFEVNKMFENKGKRTNIVLSYVDTPTPYNSIGTVEAYLLCKDNPHSNNSIYFNISNSKGNFYIGMAETDETGKATLNFPCNHLPGVYDVVVYYDGDSNFAENETVFNDKLEIVKEDSVINITTGRGDDIACPVNYETELVAKLITNSKGIGIEGIDLIFELIKDGKHTILGNASTDSNGIASFIFKPIDNNVIPNDITNKYILNVFFGDHPLYKNSSAHVYLDVTKDNPIITIEGTTISYQEEFSINATLTDSSLNPLTERWLDFFIINPITEKIEHSGTVKTDINGLATFTVAPYTFNLHGLFDIAVRFKETSVESFTYIRFENALTILQCETLITITGPTEEIPTESLRLRILLTDYNRRAIAGQQLFLECYKEDGDINLLGDDVYVLTNINGIAVFSLPLLLPDKFMLKVFYKSQSDSSPLNDGYLESQASYNFKIERIPAGLAILELNKPRIMRGETLEFTVIAQAKEAVNYIIPARLFVDGVNFDHVDILQGTFNILLGKVELFYEIPLGPSFQAGIYNFTIEIQPGTFFEGSITFSIDLVERTSLSIEYIILNTKANGKHYVNESEIIKFTLLDEDMSPLPHFIDYQIINRGISFGTVNINELGIYLLDNVPSSYGIQVCHTKYRGTRFYALSEDRISVEILKRPLVLNFIGYTHDNLERENLHYLGHRGDTLTITTRVKDYLDDVYLKGHVVEFAYDNNFIGISEASSQGGYAIFNIPLSEATGLIQEGIYSLSVRIRETKIFKSIRDAHETELVIFEVGYFECSIGTFTTEGMNYLIKSKINFFDEDGIVVDDYNFTVIIIHKKSNKVLSSFKAKSGIVPLTVSEGGFFKILIRMEEDIDEVEDVVKIVKLLYREIRIIAVQFDTGYKVIDPIIPYVDIPIFSEIITELLWQAIKWKAKFTTLLILIGLFAIFGKKTVGFTWSVIIKFIIYLLVLNLVDLDDVFINFVLHLQLAGFLYFITNALKGEDWLYNSIVFLLTQVAAIGISYYLKRRREAYSEKSEASLKKKLGDKKIVLMEICFLVFYGFILALEGLIKSTFNVFFGVGDYIFNALIALISWLWNQKRKSENIIERTPTKLIYLTVVAIIIHTVVSEFVDFFFPPIKGIFGILWEIFRITLKVTGTLLAMIYIVPSSWGIQSIYSAFVITMVDFFIDQVFSYVLSALFTTLKLPYIDPESTLKGTGP